jgi:hypothetical protein
MADSRLRDNKERLALAYKELLDSETFVEDLGNLKHLGGRDMAPEFLIMIEKLNDLYSVKKGCKWDSEMVLIDLESFECRNTKTYFRLESDINIMKLGKEDVAAILKAKQFKSDEKPNRVKVLQKEKLKMKDIEFVVATYQRISALPRIALFEELDKCKAKVEEQLDFKKKLDAKLVEFWKRWPQGSFLDCSIKLAATEKANNQLKEILAFYSKTCFRCDEIEKQLGLIENLLKSTVLRVGKKKASYCVFEKIYEILLGYPGIEDTPLLQDMKKKREICEDIKEIESCLRQNESVSYYDLKEKFSQFKNRCEEIDIKGTDDYVASVVKKIDPILNRMKPQITQEELKKIASSLAELPFKLDEQKTIDDRLKRIDAFIEKFKNQSIISNPDRLLTEYRQLDVRIQSFEAVIKKMEADKTLISSVLSETANKVDWHKANKLLSRLKNITMMDPKQAQTLIINNCLHLIELRFIAFLKKRSLCSTMESDEVILETCHTIPKQKRLEFLKKEKIQNEELKSMIQIVDGILDEDEDLCWMAEDWMREKEFELNDLRDRQRFLKNLTKDLDLTIESLPISNDLPHGAYMEDFTKGYSQSNEVEFPVELLKGILQEIQKNLEKNAVFELGKFSSFLEAERLYFNIREKNDNPKRFEVFMQRVNHFLWKIRLYKYDSLSNLVKAFQYKTDLVIRLASKSDATLKKLELKLKNSKRYKKIFNRGSCFYGMPDKLIKREALLKGRDDPLSGNKKGNLKDVHDDWKGLTAHFKVELEPGLDKSRQFDIIFSKLRCKDLGNPPMNVIFSRQLNIREFAERISNFSSNVSKEMEIGVFSSPKLFPMRKHMLKRGIIFQANLDNCNLFLFWKEQWPNLQGMTYFEQQMKNDSEMYCLFVFSPLKPAARKHSSSHLKKRESSSIFDLGEDEDREDDLESKPKKKQVVAARKDESSSEESTINRGLTTDKVTVSATAAKMSTAAPTIVDKSYRETKKYKDLANQLRILSVQIEEVKQDFDSEYETMPFTQEDMEFYEFAKTFELLNPDFVYEVGEGDYETNQNQMNGAFFNPNIDQGNIEEGIPANAGFSRESYYNQNHELPNFSNFETTDNFNRKSYGQTTFDSHMYQDEVQYDFNSQNNFHKDAYRRAKSDHFGKPTNIYSGE